MVLVGWELSEEVGERWGFRQWFGVWWKGFVKETAFGSGGRVKRGLERWGDGRVKGSLM